MDDDLKITRCARCGTVFVRIRTNICHECIDVEEEEYRVIRDVLRDQESLNVAQVAELAEVTEACVLRMLDQGLIVNDQVSNDVKCGQCGLPAISTRKRLCATCLAALDQKFYTEINEAKQRLRDESPSDSVHVTLNKKRKKSIDIEHL